MEQNNKGLQVMTNSSLPVLADSSSIVAVRLDRHRFPRYKDIPPKARQEWMTMEFRKYSALAHIKDVSARDLVVGAVALDEMIMLEDVMADLTQPEIEQAFKNGIFGKYGEFYGLTAMSLYGFLQGFLESDEKLDAAKEMRARANLEAAARREEEKRREQERVLADIAEAKRNGFVPSWGPDYHFTPKKVDSVIDSSSHKERVMKQAREILLANHQK